MSAIQMPCRGCGASIDSQNATCEFCGVQQAVTPAKLSTSPVSTHAAEVAAAGLEGAKKIDANLILAIASIIVGHTVVPVIGQILGLAFAIVSYRSLQRNKSSLSTLALAIAAVCGLEILAGIIMFRELVRVFWP